MMRFNNLYYVKKIQSDPFAQKGKKRPNHPLASQVYDLNQVDSNCRLCYSWLGHSSIFIQIDGYKLLIDPVFSKSLSLVGPKRFPGPIPQASDFPYLDVILISHNHHDHLNQKTIQMLKDKTGCFVVPSGLKRILKRFGVEEHKIIELNWNEDFHFHSLTIYCTFAHHNSTRFLLDQNKTLWCSYVIETNNHRIFYSGDTAFSQHFNDIANRFKPFDLVFIECGQYGKLWHACHMFPEESVNACQILQAKLAIPVHWGSYVLANHSYDEPPKRFSSKATEINLPYTIPALYEIDYID